MIKKLWRGDIALWKCFWLLGAVGVIFLMLLYLGLGVGFGLVAAEKLISFLIILILFTLVFVVFWTVSVWRAAGKYQGPRYIIWLTRAYIILSYLYLFGFSVTQEL